ncbi:MAG: hypothetical protein WCC66_11855, partial [Rhizobiaceae bacterium]
GPTGFDLMLFVAIGLAATLGHYLFTAAFRVAPASILAPVNYLHLFWAGIVGWLAFGHIPSQTGLIGIGLVMFAGAASAVISQHKST